MCGSLPPLPLRRCFGRCFACRAWALGSALYCYVLGLPFWTTFAEIDLLQISILGITPTATVYALRGAERDLDDLRPLLRPDARVSDTGFGQIFLLGRRTLSWIGAAGIAIALVLLFSPASWQDGKPAIEHPDLCLGRAAQLGARLARRAHGRIELAIAFGFARLGERGVEVDWLDQRPLAPFARKGLRSVFLLLLYSRPLLALPARAVGQGRGDPDARALPGAVRGRAAAAGVGRAPPARARRSSWSSRASTRRCAPRRRRTWRRARAAPAGARLSNLVAYRGLVDAANTWPFDLAVWLRFCLYVSLGLGSWLGGALVERLLGAALD